jgi:hypothetical protein
MCPRARFGEKMIGSIGRRSIVEKVTPDLIFIRIRNLNKSIGDNAEWNQEITQNGLKD